MANKSFKRVIDVDICKSTPDWEPYKRQNAPAGAVHAASKLQDTYYA